MKKKWLITLVIGIAVISSIIIYLKTRSSKDFGPIIKTKLQKIVSDGSDGLYSLQLDSIHIDVLKGELALSNINIRFDSARLAKLDSMKQAPNDVYNISLKSLVINGISPADLLEKKNVDLDKIILEGPTVEFYHQKRDYNYSAPDSINVYRRIQKSLGHFSLNELSVHKINLSYNNISKNEITKFKDISVQINHILVDSSTQNDASRFLYAKDALIFLHDYSIITSDKLYAFHFDSAMLNAASHEMNISHLTFKPNGNKNDFSEKLPYYKDRYDVDVKHAAIKNIDWYHLVAGENFTALDAKLSNGTVEVFADRTLPPAPKSKVGNYPHQLLMKVKMPIYISKIETENIKVTYKELSAKSKKTGELVFDHIQGTFTNVTNEKENFKKNNVMGLNAACSFMDAGMLHAIFKFNLAEADQGTFSVDAEIDTMDGRKLNEATEALGLFEINSARINKLRTHIDGKNFGATGTLLFLYDDLKITALKADDKTGDLKKRGLISFVANNLILEQSNTKKDENIDVKQVSFQRDIHKSFFNLIWKSMLDGIKKTVKGKD